MNDPVPSTVLRPMPLPDAVSAPFWAAAREGRLEIQRCRACSRWNHAPALLCPACGSHDLGFEPVSGRGQLFSWTIVNEAPAPGFRDRLPLMVGIVELAEQEHLLLAANIFGAAAADLRLGQQVEVWFEPLSKDCTLPQFRVKAA